LTEDQTKIDVSEVHNALKTMKPSEKEVTEEEVAALVNKLDPEKTGKIELSEL